MSRLISIASVSLWLTLSTHAFSASAAPAPLTLDVARTLALTRAPQLMAIDAGSQARAQDAIAAGQWPDPEIKLGEEKLPLNNFSADDQSMDVIGIEQMIPGGRKTELAAQFNQLSADKMRTDGQTLRLQIRRDAGMAWLDAVYPRAKLKLLNRQLAELDRRAAAQHLALAQGRAGLADNETVARTRLLLIDRIAATRADAARADAQAERWFGSVKLPDDLPQLPPPSSLAELELHLTQHPAIVAQEKAIDMARTAAQQARESRKPDWDVELEYGHARTPGMPNTVTAMLSFSVPILEGRRQDRQYAARNLDLDAATSTREANWRELRAGLYASYADWQSLDSRLTRLEPALESRAGRLVDLGLASYRSGAGAFTQVLEARENALDDAMQLLDMHYQLDRARLTLDYYDTTAGGR